MDYTIAVYHANYDTFTLYDPERRSLTLEVTHYIPLSTIRFS